MIETRVRSGRWIRMHTGVYLMAGVPPLWRQALLAACLAYGPGAVVSHLAAASLWTLLGFGEGPIELTIPRERGRIGSLRVHRVPLPAGDVTAIGALPVTTPARTLIDLASLVPKSRIEEALDDALARKLVSLPRLRRRADELSVKGRHGIACIRELIEARDAPAVPMSVLETKPFRLLRRSDLPAPVLQHAIRDRGRILAVVDFAFPDARVAIEADGRRWHEPHSRWDHDLARRNSLAALGWRVVHVTWSDLTTRPAQTVETIRSTLRHPAGVHGR